MESQEKRRLNKSWPYRLLVITLIPLLFIYYTLLQPIAIYFKDLLAEQDGSLRQRQPARRDPNVQKAFIKDATTILANKLTKVVQRYWWLIAALLFLWLTFDIGIEYAAADFALWFMIWILFCAAKSFIKAVNQ